MFKNMNTTTIIISITVFALLIYMITAYIKKLWPFSSTTDVEYYQCPACPTGKKADEQLAEKGRVNCMCGTRQVGSYTK